MKNTKFVAICKKTQKVFNDYKNLSGTLTSHLKLIEPSLIHPSSFIKRQYKKIHNQYWHEQFFNVVEIDDDTEYKKCPYCNWETKDIKNKSGQFTLHLKNKHNISIIQYLIEFPEEKELFKTFIKKHEDKEKTFSNEENFIICAICNKKMKSLTNSHLKKHNITLSDYKLKYPNREYHSKSFISKTSKNLIEAAKKIKNSYVSKPEKSLKEFLLTLGLNIDKNNRKLLNGVEIDVINHENKIGIEFNGNLYHSENYGGKQRKFHLNKTELMNQKNYRLIHIFEDEWENKNKIVKNKLKHIFNKNNSTIIHARKCILKEIDSTLKNNFLNNNHIQGEDKSNVHVGAFFNDELISVMTFDNNRQMNKKQNKKDEYELKRFCTSSKYIISGIANRLLSFFIKKYNPKKIISFADRRWTLNKNNNLYVNLGFKLTKILPPDYTYYNSKISRYKRLHKFSFGKSSLKKKYPEIYNENKTEWEMMQELGYDRIWDCGKFKYELIF